MAQVLKKITPLSDPVKVSVSNKSGIKQPKKKAKPKIARVEQPKQPAAYTCCCCGSEYTKQESNFPHSQSQVFIGNNSYLPICNSCCDNLVAQYTELLGSEEAAIKRMCQRWDLYFSPKLLESSLQTDVTKSRFKKYISLCNLRTNMGKTYDTYLIESRGERINSLEQLERFEGEEIPTGADGEEQQKPAEEIVKKFGVGFTLEEYQLLNELYTKLVKKAGRGKKLDDIKETLIQDACNTAILKKRAFKEGNVDNYDKTSKLYQNTLAKIGVNEDDIDDDNSDIIGATWGTLIQTIENFTPAEVYKDKKLFKDHDSIEEYFNRFIIRPFRNFFTGSNEQDPEFSIKNGEDE